MLGKFELILLLYIFMITYFDYIFTVFLSEELKQAILLCFFYTSAFCWSLYDKPLVLVSSF